MWGGREARHFVARPDRALCSLDASSCTNSCAGVPVPTWARRKFDPRHWRYGPCWRPWRPSAAEIAFAPSCPFHPAAAGGWPPCAACRRFAPAPRRGYLAPRETRSPTPPAHARTRRESASAQEEGRRKRKRERERERERERVTESAAGGAAWTGTKTRARPSDTQDPRATPPRPRAGPAGPSGTCAAAVRTLPQRPARTRTPWTH